MSILLTDDEVSILLHENTYLTDGDFARAIQLALFEKIRKEPDITLGEYGLQWTERGFNNHQPIGAVFAYVPAAQELENER